MKPQAVCFGGAGIFVLILATLIVMTGQTVIAAPDAPATEQQAKQQKIDSYIQICREYIKRAMYIQAQGQLHSIETELATYATPQQKQTIESLAKEIEQITAERERISGIIRQSDELINQGDLLQAKSLLEQVKSSRYMTVPEQKMIVSTLEDVNKKLALQTLKMQELFDKSVEFYKAGKADPARDGFVQVAASGLAVRGDKTPQEYLLMMEQAAQKPPAAASSPQAAGANAQQDIQGEELMEMAAEPNAVKTPAKTPQARQQTGTAAATGQPPVPVLPEAPVAQTQPGQDAYILEVNRVQAVQISYTKAIVKDSLDKAASSLADNDFDNAMAALRRGFSTVEKNKILLGDQQYTELKSQLTAQEGLTGRRQQEYTDQLNREKQQQAQELTKNIRESMESQRKKAIEEYMDRAYVFQDQQRYDEALGQIEQLLAIDPQNQRALILKKTLENTVRWVEQIRVRDESDKEEINLLLEANRRSIPYSKEINYPKDWKDLAARRDKQVAMKQSPADMAVQKLLDQTVDLSRLAEQTSLTDAIEILRNSVQPPLSVVVLWKDLSENAFIEPDTPINMSGQGLSTVSLRTGLDSILKSVSAGALSEVGYVVENGIITIATRTSLPSTLQNVIYDVAELLNPPANYDEYNTTSQSGQGGGGGMMGGGGGMGGGGMMGGGGGGGMMGGGGGMMGGGGGMMGGGGGGGMMGGGGGNVVGNWQSRTMGYELIYVIMQSVDPDSWYENGGEGRIEQFNGNKLIIWQTPEIHQKIKEFLEMMKAELGQQVAIEARFLLVDENYLEDVGLDTEIGRLKLGGKWGGGTGIVSLSQDSFGAVVPGTTVIGSSLASTANDNPALASNFAYGSIVDDLQVTFMLRATQMHSNAKQLTAPKAMVLSGESATMQVVTRQRLRTDATLNTETLSFGGETSGDRTVYYITNDYEDFDSGVRMVITPTISSDKKYVLLRISTYLTDLTTSSDTLSVGVNQAGGVISANIAIPTTQTSSIQTRVSVPDRGTVLLGGLTMTAQKEKEAGVPVLSKIPLLGRLFSNRSEVKDKRILLILVRPTIVLREEAEEDATAALK